MGVSSAALGGSQAVFGAASLFVLGGAGASQAMLKIDAVSYESCVIPYDDCGPLSVDWSHAVVGTIGDQLWVLCDELGWDTAAVIDLARAAPPAPEPEPAPEEEALTEETPAADAATEEAAPATEEETSRAPPVCEGSKWKRVQLEADSPGSCEPGKRAGVFLDDEAWIVTSSEQGLDVHLLSTGSRLRQMAENCGQSDDPEAMAEWEAIQEQMKTQGRSHWIKPPVSGAAPPPLTHFKVSLVGRSLWVLGGRLLQKATSAFKGDGCEYESGYDYAYVLDTDRC